MGAENLKSFILDSYYSYGFREGAHQLLAWGYQDALPQIHYNLEEEDITGLIVEAIDKRLDDPTSRKFERYSIHEEKPIAVEGRRGKKRRRLDLVVVSSDTHPRSKYVFEAKRLRKNGYPIGKYVGEDGLQCFIKGVYASHCPEAAMVGYDQSGDASHWEKELRRCFDDNLRNDLCVKQLLQKVHVLSSIPNVWVSEHERVTGRSIAIYHIFFNCSASSAQTAS